MSCFSHKIAHHANLPHIPSCSKCHCIEAGLKLLQYTLLFTNSTPFHIQETWNVYNSTLLSANPLCVLEVFGYQSLITSTSLHLPFSAWMSYDTKFHTLAANYPSFCWDVRHPEVWLECMTIPKPTTSECWPCLHYNSICDLILENWPNCHIWYFEKYWF